MKEVEHRLSRSRILWTDYPAFYASLVPIVSWVIYLAWAPNWRGDGPIIQAQARPFFLALAVVASLTSLTVVALRLRLLSRTFRSGAIVRGKISKVELRRDRGRVEFAYIYEHKEYFSASDVHRNGRTKELQAGEQVMLVVDPTKPSRAFIRHLYTHS